MHMPLRPIFACPSGNMFHRETHFFLFPYAYLKQIRELKKRKFAKVVKRYEKESVFVKFLYNTVQIVLFPFH